MSRPIGDYALLSDCQGSALVARDGSIDWACLPRFDSPALFAGLLDPQAGHWRIAPIEAGRARRSYLPDTMVLRTEFATSTGVMAVTDALALGSDEVGHRIGHGSPHIIVRCIEGIEGVVEVGVDLAPRPGYGLTAPVLIAEPGGLQSHGGPHAYIVSSEVPLTVSGSDARATVRIEAGDVLHLALRVASPWDPRPALMTGAQMAAMLDATITSWRSWSGLHQSYDGPYSDLVRHSGRVLQALSYAPTGAVVAAPTTSLPETVGGERNWDYRFCWVRDASLTLEALWIAACPHEAADFFAFIATAAGGRIPIGKDLQILYGVGGERLVPEHELTHLAGYRASRPVRVGNGAWDQVQIDVYGELLSAAWLLADQVGSFDQVTARFLVDVADTAAARWADPDQGIWEVRGAPRHFVYSKLMCWVALDRAVRLAGMLDAAGRVAEWTAERERIRQAIETQGWSEKAGAFAQSFGSDELDASNLMLLLTGFLPASDPRMRATVEAIAATLSDARGFVYRYLAPDGLAGEEGTFVICTFWLVQCLAELGELDRARTLFDRLVGFANDVGLLSEQIDAETGELLGNFPQAFTHIGLVNAAWAIARAQGSPVAASEERR
ncbi:MAG: glycoside hydrolase family 15 protein [Actinomycetota bacterium]|nr:glycoside hydrolase family 15 protein [Actinomycetota bacterium]